MPFPGSPCDLRRRHHASRRQAGSPGFISIRSSFPRGCAIYPRWYVAGSRLLAFLPLLLLVAGMALLWTRRKSWGRAPFFAAAYFLITLLPVMGFLDMSFMRLSLVADHLPVRCHDRRHRVRCRAFWPEPPPGTVEAGARSSLAAAGCVAVLAILTCRRASLYERRETRLARQRRQDPHGLVAWSNLGKACTDKACTTKRSGASTKPSR